MFDGRWMMGAKDNKKLSLAAAVVILSGAVKIKNYKLKIIN
jgi:hypothetical protein